MFGSPDIRMNNNIFLFWFIGLIVVSPLLCIPVLGEKAPGSEDGTTMAQYENGTVTAEWAVDFTASPLEGYPPLCAKFTVEGPLGDYLWDFGDGSTSTSRNPVHCYQKQGSYMVTLKYFVGQITGELHKEDYIRVKDPLTFVDYKVDPANGTAPLAVQFSTIGTPTNIIWDFDDGEQSTEVNPRHLYQQPGFYSPKLTYCIAGVCDKISKYNYVEVSPGDEVNFTAERQEGKAPLSTKFITTGPVETCSWDFGDGTTSYEKNPGHYYTQPGNYDVTLTYSIKDASYTITRPDYIHVTSQVTPDFNSSTRGGIAPLCVDFDMINRPQSWLWMYGDNLTSSDEHGTHCYGLNGSYDVGLHYCYNGYCNDVIKPGYISVQNPRIFADTGVDEATVKFRTDAGEGLTYAWDFGDQATSESAAPIHRYEEPGEYNVTLSILGTCGCTSKVSTLVRVSPKKPLDFSATPLEGCAPHCVQFSESSPAVTTENRTWNFGDGETSIEKNPFHCYQFPGKYTVTLVNGSSEQGENVTKTDYISVYAVPQPSFSTNPSSGEAPVTVTFTDTTVGYESKRSWDFGDGVTDTGARTDHRYVQEGVYNVSLTVWGEGDCHGTVTHDIHVTRFVEKKYDLTGLPRRGIAPVCTSFSKNGSPYQWSIDFGDGQSTSEGNPFHCYQTPGIYSPTLHVCDAEGCEDIPKPGYVVVIPPAYQNLSLSPGWNLVSPPVSLEPGRDTASIFAHVQTAGHSLYSWDSISGQWKHLSKDSPMDPLSGVWIYSVLPTEVSLPISSTGPEGNLTRDLAKGWNLISFPWISPVSPNMVFSEDLNWSYLLGYDAKTQRYTDPIEKGKEGDQMIDPRQGYWLYMASPGSLKTPGL